MTFGLIRLKFVKRQLRQRCAQSAFREAWTDFPEEASPDGSVCCNPVLAQSITDIQHPFAHQQCSHTRAQTSFSLARAHFGELQSRSSVFGGAGISRKGKLRDLRSVELRVYPAQSWSVNNTIESASIAHRVATRSK